MFLIFWENVKKAGTMPLPWPNRHPATAKVVQKPDNRRAKCIVQQRSFRVGLDAVCPAPDQAGTVRGSVGNARCEEKKAVVQALKEKEQVVCVRGRLRWGGFLKKPKQPARLFEMIHTE